MDNIISIKYYLKKDYTNLKEVIKNWYNAIRKEQGLCLAISRKAPRLLEWCAMTWGIHNDYHSPIITELALPFIDIENYTGSCVVVDEAIYHGTTFQKVTSITETVCKNNPSLKIKAIPMVVTDEALLSKEIRSYLHTNTVIGHSDCQFFINTIIAKFLTLGKPYDIEYPLFYIDFKNKITDNQIESFLRKLTSIESEKRSINIDDNVFYKTQTYSREENKDYFAYSYLTDYLYKDEYGRNKPEFSKIRIFYKENRLCIVSMSPYILSGDDLVATNGMLRGDLKEIWEIIYNSVKTFDNEDEEYLYQKKKSLVVMTNYLLSFANFLQIKDSIKKAIQFSEMQFAFLSEQNNNSIFKMDNKDLTYLVGKDLANTLLPYLYRYLSFPHTLNQIITPSLILADIQYSSIPLDYKNAYETQMSSDNIYSSDYSVSAMISSMFSAMHSQIELPSRIRMNSFNRLRFGESYRSIIDRFSLYCTDRTKMYKEIHQSIDQRVDFGSVVPNYIQRNASFDSSYWLRMFRSGENEDLNKDRILRQIIVIIKKFLSYNRGTILHLFEFEFIMALLYRREQEESDLKRHPLLFGKKLNIRLTKEMYQSCIELENNKTVALIEYAKDSHILTEDKQHFLKLTDSSYVKILSDGSIWSTEEDATVDKYIEYVYSFTQRNSNPLLIRETLNYLFFEKMNYINDLKNWIMRLNKDIKINSVINIDEKDKEFKSLFYRLPEPFLKLTKEDYKNEDQEIKDLREDIFRSINEYKNELLENSIFDKIMIVYYITNLWNYYKNKTTARDFDIDDYIFSFNFLQDKRMKFADGIDMYSWLKEEGNFERIQNINFSELQSRLTQILKEIA